MQERWNQWQQDKARGRLVRVADLVRADMSKVEIARKLHISRTMLYRLIAKAKERGLL